MQPTGQPDVYRVLTATGGAADMDQDVYVIGKDWGDNLITDRITLSGTNTVIGSKPFKSVDHIILPARTAPLQTVRIGTANRLGLQAPIASAAGIVQVSRKAMNEDVYTAQASVGLIDVTYATLGLSIAAGDSYEVALAASD